MSCRIQLFCCGRPFRVFTVRSRSPLTICIGSTQTLGLSICRVRFINLYFKNYSQGGSYNKPELRSSTPQLVHMQRVRRHDRSGLTWMRRWVREAQRLWLLAQFLVTHTFPVPCTLPVAFFHLSVTLSHSSFVTLQVNRD